MISHGLSYTSFTLSNLKISEPTVSGDQFNATVIVTLTNTGSLAGSQVIQLYIGLPDTSDFTHPRWQLCAFEKVRDMRPGESRYITLVLDRLSVSYWEKAWIVEDGTYNVRVAFSSEEGADEGQEILAKFTISKGFEWTGL